MPNARNPLMNADAAFKEFQRVVARCRELGDSAPGAFWLATRPTEYLQALVKVSAPVRMKAFVELAGISSSIAAQRRLYGVDEIAALLNSANLPGAPHDVGSLKGSLKVFDFRTQASSSWHGKTDAPMIDHGLRAQQWSMSGALVYASFERPLINALGMMFVVGAMRSNFSLLDEPFNEPSSLPVRESFIEPRGLGNPINQWLPAFADADGRTHDLLDLATLSMCPEICSDLLLTLRPFEFPDDARAGYLARQAARAYDIAVGAGLSTELGEAPGAIFKACCVAGAQVTQEQWAGANPEASKRSFGDLAELSYPLMSESRQLLLTAGLTAGNADGDAYDAIQRLASVDPTVVGPHVRDRNDSADGLWTPALPKMTPLRWAAEKGDLKAGAALLSSGAELDAVSDVKGAPTSVRQLIESMERPQARQSWLDLTAFFF